MDALDPKKVAELVSLMGESVTSVYEAFNKSAQHCLQDLELAINHLDIHKIEQASHTLKGSSANIGALQLSLLCDEIVSKARNADNDYTGHYDKVAEEYEKVKVAISRLLNQ